MHAANLTRFCSALAVLFLASSLAPGEVALPTGGAVREVDFERHVMGVLGRAGCNLGSCHGSFQGKGGFRLSLFGYDAEKDYFALTREASGRRLNPVDPDRSLLLLKATGQVEHGGGRRFSAGSWQYQLLRDWIVRGAPRQKGSGDVAEVKIEPPEFVFHKPGERGRLTVRIRFGDGVEEDITSFCDFRTNDDAIVEVDRSGAVRSNNPGDTAVVVSYRSQVRAVRVLVPREAEAGFRYPDVPEANYVDREVFAKLRRLNLLPSDLADDADFLRRLTIDTTASLPSRDEVRQFLADPTPDKKARKIDELLAHPLHAALWATKFSDVTGNNTDTLEIPQATRPKRSQMWHDWLRKRVAENLPYDEIVRGVLCATSRDGLQPEEWVKQVKDFEDAAQKGFALGYAERPTLDLFWRRQQRVPLEQWGEKAAAAFLGVRLECAQCHKHPFDRWTQADYRAFANVFSQVSFGTSPEAKKVVDAENAEIRKQMDRTRQGFQIREVWVAARGQPLTHPDTNRPLPAQALGGPELKGDDDLRVALFHWLRAPDNPLFARSFVNRVWGHYFGVGLVDPVDDFSQANPPSNEKLLDALARDFVEHQYDIRHLERTILNARVYQLSSATNDTNRLDRRNYSHAYIRPLMAEAVVDVLNSALGVTENFGAEAPPNARAVEVGASRLLQNRNLDYALRIFGRPPRTTACDCERGMEPALPQKLFLMSNQLVQDKIRQGRLRELLDSKKTDEEILEELFLATLSRLPTEREKQVFAESRDGFGNRQAAFTATVWALINTREFILNH